VLHWCSSCNWEGAQHCPNLPPSPGLDSWVSPPKKHSPAPSSCPRARPFTRDSSARPSTLGSSPAAGRGRLQRRGACSVTPSRCTSIAQRRCLFLLGAVFLRASSCEGFFFSAGSCGPAPRSGLARGQGVYVNFIPWCVPVNSVSYFGPMMYMFFQWLCLFHAFLSSQIKCAETKRRSREGFEEGKGPTGNRRAMAMAWGKGWVNWCCWGPSGPAVGCVGTGTASRADGVAPGEAEAGLALPLCPGEEEEGRKGSNPEVPSQGGSHHPPPQKSEHPQPAASHHPRRGPQPPKLAGPWGCGAGLGGLLPTPAAHIPARPPGLPSCRGWGLGGPGCLPVWCRERSSSRGEQWPWVRVDRDHEGRWSQGVVAVGTGSCGHGEPWLWGCGRGSRCLWVPVPVGSCPWVPVPVGPGGRGAVAVGPSARGSWCPWGCGRGPGGRGSRCAWGRARGCRCPRSRCRQVAVPAAGRRGPGPCGAAGAGGSEGSRPTPGRPAGDAGGCGRGAGRGPRCQRVVPAGCPEVGTGRCPQAAGWPTPPGVLRGGGGQPAVPPTPQGRAPATTTFSFPANTG